MHPSSLFAAISSAIVATVTIISAQNAAPGSAPAVQTAVSTTSQSAAVSKPYVDRIAICLDIKDNEPDVIDTVFPPNVKRLYCFTAIKGASGISEIQHRWYYNDDLQSSISLKVGSSNWRTYSAKSIPAVYTGEWLVAIVNSQNEEVIKTCKFYVNP